VAAGGTARADFQLGSAAISLDALVVTGTAGATQKRAIGNAVTTVSAEDLTSKAPISNVTQLLQARAPGLSINPGAGTSGTAAQIRIRGQGSVAGAQIPIFIMDGVRISNVQNGWAVSGQSRNPLDFINPDDIESIEVVKGPAAATLYGAEAANGVIQIITKKGRKGQQGMQWNGKVEYGEIDWTIDTPTNWSLCTNARIRTSGSGTVGSFPGCAGIDSLLPANAEQRLLSRNFLRDEANTLRTGELTNYSLSTRGGGDRYSFFVSGELQKETGVFYNNDTGRRSGRANFTVNPTDKLDISANLSYARTNSRLPLNDNASNGLLRNGIRGVPGRQGQYAVGWLGLSPAEINIYDNKARSDRMVLGATANYSPFLWFRNRVTVGVDHNVGVAENFYPIWRGTAPSPYGADVANGAIYQFTPERRSYTLDYAGTLSNTIPWGELSSDFSFGAQLNSRRYEFTRGEGEGLISNDLRSSTPATSPARPRTQEAQSSLGFFVQEQVGLAGQAVHDRRAACRRQLGLRPDFSTVVYPEAVGLVRDLRRAVLQRAVRGQPAAARGLGVRPVTRRNRSRPTATTAARRGGCLRLGHSALRSTTTATRTSGGDRLRARDGLRELAPERPGRRGLHLLQQAHLRRAAPDPVAPSSGFGGGELGAGSTATYRTRLVNAGRDRNRGIELSLWGHAGVAPQLRVGDRLGVSTNRTRWWTWRAGDAAARRLRHHAVDPRGLPAGQLLRRCGSPATGRHHPEGRARPRHPEQRHRLHRAPRRPTREVAFSNTFTLFGNLRFYVFADYKGGNYMWNAGEFVRNRNDVSPSRW
jgi:TonB-dependent SusC/RagA subfamily outer membrane receptor